MFTVNDGELTTLKAKFRDLAYRSGPGWGHTVDKETFLKFLPWPGLLGGETGTRLCVRGAKNQFQLCIFIECSSVLGV